MRSVCSSPADEDSRQGAGSPPWPPASAPGRPAIETRPARTSQRIVADQILAGEQPVGLADVARPAAAGRAYHRSADGSMSVVQTPAPAASSDRSAWIVRRRTAADPQGCARRRRRSVAGERPAGQRRSWRAQDAGKAERVGLGAGPAAARVMDFLNPMGGLDLAREARRLGLITSAQRTALAWPMALAASGSRHISRTPPAMSARSSPRQRRSPCRWCWRLHGQRRRRASIASPDALAAFVTRTKSGSNAPALEILADGPGVRSW